LSVTRSAYRAAGVDVEAGERAVDLIRRRVEATFGPAVLTGLGSFAAGVALPAGMREPVLVSATDGVGTKTAIAVALGRYDTIGIDLVAMCADDVACLGARPLFMLDYVAVERLEPARLASIVDGIAAGCRSAGCALVGGETAEHPGLLPQDGFDLAGFCVGVAERADLLAEPLGRAGDALVGLASSGLHANGFSLVRRLIAERQLDLGEPFADFARRVLGETPADANGSLGEALLRPTRIYAADVLALRDHLGRLGHAVHGIAHVTGGGLPANLPRALADDAAARIDPQRWPQPAVIAAMARLADLSAAEARAIFNGGLGMVVAVEPAGAQAALDFLRSRGQPAWLVGDVVRREGEQRYFEEQLP
jgi:phosphoribosylformylglycinamidine cyclo-ligase